MSVITRDPRLPHRGDVKTFTLIFVKHKGRLLLGMKKRGFGVGKWNGFGGKVNSGESVEQGAVRELEEECGLLVKPDELRDLGSVVYVDPQNVRHVHVFGVLNRSDGCRESDEMLPRWFAFDEVPYDRMWPDAEHWIPYVLSDTKVRATFVYGSNEEIVYKQVEKIAD